jgi:hypothetical protein
MIVLVIGVVTDLNVTILPCRNRVYELAKPLNKRVQQKIDFLFSPLGRVRKQVLLFAHIERFNVFRMQDFSF